MYIRCAEQHSVFSFANCPRQLFGKSWRASSCFGARRRPFFRFFSPMSSLHAPQQRAQALVAHLTAASTAVAASPASASASSSHKVLEQDEGGRYEGDYGFTLDPKHALTAQQRRQYDEQGFLLIRKLVSEADIEKWRQRFVAIANGEVEPTPTMLVMRDVAIAKKKEKGEHAITKLQDW
jgi:hypothetical protein